MVFMKFLLVDAVLAIYCMERTDFAQKDICSRVVLQSMFPHIFINLLDPETAIKLRKFSGSAKPSRNTGRQQDRARI